MDITFKLDVSKAVRKLNALERPEAALRPALEAAKDRLTRHMKERTPTASGKLQRGWQGAVVATTAQKIAIRISNSAPHANLLVKALEKGTKRHLILPRNRKALMFSGLRNVSRGGSAYHETVFAKKARHPGARISQKWKSGESVIASDIEQLKKDVKDRLVALANSTK